jgi:hypothetical protein
MDGLPELLRDLLDAGPVLRFGPAVLVTGHVEVAAIHRDAARFSSRAGLGSVADQVRAGLGPADRDRYDELQAFRRLLMAREDDPLHKRLRGLAHRAFTPRRIASIRADVENYMETLLDQAAVAESLDLATVAYRLPLMVIGDLLDVPDADREQMHEWTKAFAENVTRTDPASIGAALDAIGSFVDYCEGLLGRWRSSPGTSQLVDALAGTGQEEALTAAELAGMFVQLMVAGHETTAHLVSRGVYELTGAPDQWAALCAEPEELAANATEELLRVVSPLQWQTRVPTEDLEIAGVEVSAGTTVQTIIAAANRDPSVFDDPDRIDVRRVNARSHLAFGVGPHFCLGASLARMEGEVALAALARRFRDMRLVAGSVRWVGKPELPALAELRVTV